MNTDYSVREGEPVRFSLTSRYALPAALVAHARTTFARFFGPADETFPQVSGLESLSMLCPSASRDLDAATYAEVRDELRGPTIALGVDCALLRGEMAVTGPKLIVTDVDSTFIAQEVIEMLAAAAGSEEEVRAVTERAMRGELDFAASLTERVATLRGIPESIFSDVAKRVRLTPGADDVVATIHAHGGTFGLVSGGFHEVVDRVAQPLQVDEILANRLEVVDGALTGLTVGPIIDRDAKAQALAAWAAEREIPLELTVAAGDGANDLGMMDVAGLSVAFCAKPVVLAQAQAAITIDRLDALLALLGWDSVSASNHLFAFNPSPTS